ncbi:MAG TPA: hypothetical protein ENN78_00925, partial [Candidatus Omnitrophica bacterium]|nr:hypothetical protein [Candidatus Omnitrophota bacterium]
MEILVHICCAPCAIEVVNEAKRLGYSRITGYFANPNIHPYAEFENRKKALLDYSASSGLNCCYLDYNPYDFFKALGT